MYYYDDDDILLNNLEKFKVIKKKQAENGLQSQSSENGSVALWIKIAVILNWR